MTGRIIQSLSGFYAVDDGRNVYRCKARGIFRNNNVSPLVGDYVDYEILSTGEGIINALRPRKNFFVRPSVANIDTLVILASEATPVTDPFLIDRMTVLCESKSCEPVIAINKTDLADGRKLAELYAGTGYSVILCSANTGAGIDELRDTIRGKVSCFTGNSGVGKSSLINILLPGVQIETGEISRKLGRGRHTTRHVELYNAGEGTYIADTPGFAAFDYEKEPEISIDKLASFFPEFRESAGACRFDDCRHINEPDCEIRRLVLNGAISQSRHDSYARLYKELREKNPWS